MPDTLNRFLQDTATNRMIRIDTLPFALAEDESGHVLCGREVERGADAQIVNSGGELVVEKLDAEARITVNDLPVNRMIFVDGDTLGVGGVEFALVSSARSSHDDDDEEDDDPIGWAGERSKPDRPESDSETGLPLPPTANQQRTRLMTLGGLGVLLGIYVIYSLFIYPSSRVIEAASASTTMERPATAKKPAAPVELDGLEVRQALTAEAKKAYLVEDFDGALTALTAQPGWSDALIGYSNDLRAQVTAAVGAFEAGKAALAERRIADARMNFASIADIESSWLVDAASPFEKPIELALARFQAEEKARTEQAAAIRRHRAGALELWSRGDYEEALARLNSAPGDSASLLRRLKALQAERSELAGRVGGLTGTEATPEPLIAATAVFDRQVERERQLGLRQASAGLVGMREQLAELWQRRALTLSPQEAGAAVHWARYGALREASRLGAGAEAQGAFETMKATIQDRYREAYRMESADLERAVQLWSEVLQLAPPDNIYHAKADAKLRQYTGRSS